MASNLLAMASNLIAMGHGLQNEVSSDPLQPFLMGEIGWPHGYQLKILCSKMQDPDPMQLPLRHVGQIKRGNSMACCV